MEIEQYAIVLVNLDPTIGSEMRKTRPAVVVSPNELNRHLQTIVIAPITSSSKPYPTRVEVDTPNVKGWVVLDQIRTVDRKRVIRLLDNLNNSEITLVKEIIKQTFVD